MVDGVSFGDGGGVISDLVCTRVEGCIVDILGDGFIVGVVLSYGCKAGSIFLKDFYSG
jgi:hypothetical protein